MRFGLRRNDGNPHRSSASRALSLGSQALDRAFVACAVLALLTVWLFHYPAGIDLPQHANILRILMDYGDSRTGYAAFYQRQFLTPYFATYLVALPFAKLFGPLVGVKVVLSIAAIATPWTMIKWLRALRGEAWWGLFGFPLTFGFGYLWGFLSFVFVMPLMFGYLIAYRRLVERPTAQSSAVAAVWALATYFGHGIAFGVAMLTTGIEWLLSLPRTRSLRTLVTVGAHWLPAAAISLAWQRKANVPGLIRFEHWPPDNDRLVALLSGELASWPSYYPVLAGVAFLVLMAVVSRPALVGTPARLVPLLVALALFFLLPESVTGTWLVGMRMLVFVHMFALAAFRPGVVGRGLTAMRAVTTAVVIGSLLFLGARLQIFNREMKGLTAITKAVPTYADVRPLVGETDTSSDAFSGMMTQTPAWLTAANAGFLENDSGHYFQLPIQRPLGEPWLGEYRWFVARGGADIPEKVAAKVGPVQVVERADTWWLLHSTAPPLVVGNVEIARYSQGAFLLAVGHAFSGAPLRVGGRAFASGLATHAPSRIEVRLPPAGPRLTGLVGIDDDVAGHATTIVFKVTSIDGKKVLFQSPPISTGHAAVPFSVDLQGARDLLLTADIARPATTIDNAHADWLDLKVGAGG
jgi:hypothetical protein